MIKLCFLSVFIVTLVQLGLSERPQKHVPQYEPGSLPQYMSQISDARSQVYNAQQKPYQQQQSSKKPTLDALLRYLGDTVEYIKGVLFNVLRRLQVLEGCNEEDLPKPQNGRRSCRRTGYSSSNYYPGYGQSYGQSYGSSYYNDELECDLTCKSGYVFPRYSDDDDPDKRTYTCKNGKWEPNVIVDNCYEPCKEFDVDNADVTCVEMDTSPYFACTVECDTNRGFENGQPATNTYVRTCSNGVRWETKEDQIPTCVPRCSFPALREPQGGYVVCSPNMESVESCTLVCFPPNTVQAGDARLRKYDCNTPGGTISLDKCKT